MSIRAPSFPNLAPITMLGDLINTSSGFVSFADYLFLLSCLSCKFSLALLCLRSLYLEGIFFQVFYKAASKRQFELLFKMVDEDGNGVLDYHEFTKAQRSSRSYVRCSRPCIQGDRQKHFRRLTIPYLAPLLCEKCDNFSNRH